MLKHRFDTIHFDGWLIEAMISYQGNSVGTLRRSTESLTSPSCKNRVFFNPPKNRFEFYLLYFVHNQRNFMILFTDYYILFQEIGDLI